MEVANPECFEMVDMSGETVDRPAEAIDIGRIAEHVGAHEPLRIGNTCRVERLHRLGPLGRTGMEERFDLSPQRKAIMTGVQSRELAAKSRSDRREALLHRHCPPIPLPHRFFERRRRHSISAIDCKALGGAGVG
ncbi:hypothetical protein SPHINGO8AM_200126 [Sphingomonas sp. 8AM]|nr:hypothetical protein SPHINGO8AM_200126 [Sphingomonas sp. 8AM]